MEYITDRLIDQICREITAGSINLFNTHMLIKAQAKEYVRESQIRLILQPIADRLRTTFRNGEILAQHLIQMIDTWREKLPLKPGYVGGNILNLLIYLKQDMSGRDFSQLTI
jgi:hypothetical protein